MATAIEITAWIKSLPGVLTSKPCRVTIGKETWEACRYTRAFDEDKPSRWVREFILCVGKLPKAKRDHPRSSCFPFEGLDWYVAGHSSTTEVNEWQPFGYDFQLSPWDCKDGSKIDTHERWTYKRFPMTVTEVAA